MANESNYPNGWKDGWSSADHETQNYSPYAAERDQREALATSAENERRMAEYQAGLDIQQANRARVEAERLKEDWKVSEWEREGLEQVAQRREAINIIVQQKREQYNQKSWFGKAIGTLRGKSFDKMKKQITEEAEKRVDRMGPEGVEVFLERQAEKEGKQR